MTRSQRLIMVAVVLILIVALDQATKLIAIQYLKGRAPISFPEGWYPKDLFRLQFATNTGAFLSLGSQLSEGLRFWLLTAINAAILVAVGAFLVTREKLHSIAALALTLILAGGVGNLIDRLFRDGKVVDFMNLGIGNGRFQRTGIFNVADLAIVGGLALLVLLEFRRPKHADEDDAGGEAAAE